MKISEYKFEELLDNNTKKYNDGIFKDGIMDKRNINGEAVQKELRDIIENAKLEAARQTEIIEEQAKKNGYKVGYQKGLEQGTEETKEKFDRVIDDYIKKVEQAISKLINTSDNINGKYKELENSATEAVLSIASKVIAKRIDEDKSVIASMVKEALNLMESKKIKIKLNPENAKNIENKIEAISNNKIIEIVEDNKLSKGSILLEEEDGNIIDAGVNAKLEQITNSIKNE